MYYLYKTKSPHNLSGDNVDNLKKQCSGDNSPIKCLQEDKGDIAFVSSKYTIHKEENNNIINTT